MPYTQILANPMHVDTVNDNREEFFQALGELADKTTCEKLEWMIDRLAHILLQRGVIKSYNTARSTAAIFFRQCVVKEAAAGCSFLELTKTGRENAVRKMRK